MSDHRGQRRALAWFIVLLSFVNLALAISCDNFGAQQANGTCSCPPGFGGTDCSLAACGGNIFQGASRTDAQVSTTFPFSNVTACACESGWGGVGCNGSFCLSFCCWDFVALIMFGKQCARLRMPVWRDSLPSLGPIRLLVATHLSVDRTTQSFAVLPSAFSLLDPRAATSTIRLYKASSRGSPL